MIPQPSTLPTMPISADLLENLIQKYIADLAKNKTSNDNNSNNNTSNDQGKDAAPTLDLARPEPFSKPTPIPPIGNELLTSSPTQSIQPIESAIEKQQSFGPIRDQLIDTENISRIEDIPKISGIDSMDDIFKQNEFKRYVVLANTDIGAGTLSQKNFKTNDKTTKRTNANLNMSKTLKKTETKNDRLFTNKLVQRGIIRKVPRALLTPQEMHSLHVKHLIWRRKTPIIPQPSTFPAAFSFTKRFWRPNAHIKQNEVFMISPGNPRISELDVRKIMLRGKKVYIPPPPPLDMKALEPFKKAPEIENISKNSITIENPPAIEGIDKHLISIDKQQEIPPISDHVINHENIKPIKPIPNIQDIPINP